MKTLADVVPARRSSARERSWVPASGRTLGHEVHTLVVAIRPRQWLKNALLLMAFAFSIGEAWQLDDAMTWLPLLLRAVLGVVAFSAVASSAYLVNDLRDLDRDRAHPTKRLRPLAAGTLSPGTAVAAAVLLLAVGGMMALGLGEGFSLVLIAYVFLTLAYSYSLKHLIIVDLIALAIGFVLRAVAGAVAIGVPISPWLYLCTLLGALFVAINKRRHELTLLQDDATRHRPMLAHYSPALLDQMATVVIASTFVAYALYTVTAPNLPRNHAMLATVPFVIHGIFRYLYLVHQQGAGGRPEDVILRDRPLQLTVVLWVVFAMIILSVDRHW